MIHAERIRPRRKGAAAEFQPPPTPDYQALFESVPDPCLVMDREFRIVAANNAYLRVTSTSRDDIIGRGMLEVFPDNPDDPSATGATNLLASLNQVLQNKVADTTSVQRYDVRGPEGHFKERYWSTTNTPVFGKDGDVLYIIHRVHDITDLVHLKEEEKVSEGLRQQAEAELLSRSREVAETNQELKRTVAALHESQQLFNAFMEKLPVAAWIKDLQGKYVFANAAMERLFNTTTSAMLGRTGFEVFAEELAGQFSGTDRRVREEGISTPFNVVRLAGEGERYLMVSKFPITGDDGKPEYIAGLGYDITETKRLEAEIERLATYPMLNPNPVLEMDASGNVSFCNPAAQEIMSGAGSCKDGNPFVPPDIAEITEELASGRVAEYSREVDVNGRVFEEVLVLSPQPDTVRCYTMDVTNRKRAESERAELLLKMEAVLENINDGVIIADLQGNVVTMNKEALQLLEFASVDEVRQHASYFQQKFELAELGGKVLPIEDWPLMRAVSGERFFDWDLRVTSKHSGRVWIANYSGSPVLDTAGKAILAVITLRDITGRKELENRIAELNEALAARVAELEFTNQEMEAFNRMVSHDLRQPLNTIGTSCQALEMLCGDQMDDDCKNYVRMAYSKVRSMNDLISALLSFSRSTHSEIRKELVSLSELANNVAAEVRMADPARAVRFDIAEGVQGYGDRNLLRSVLENLIGNAWKYSNKQQETVIEFGASDRGGERIYYVRDNGAGFDMKQAKEIFAPFKRLSATESTGGFGIGLATVERIVRRHGGRIWAESAPGAGATFFFTLGGAEE